jgi:putative nucleotidyltransferase with HDIG domain
VRVLQEQALLNHTNRPRAGGWAHLAGRFLKVVSARPLTDSERARVTGWLRPSEVDLYYAQPAHDQRHGLEAALFVSSHTERTELARAALLHDIGKRQARLGPIGRSLVTAWTKLGGKPGRRGRKYLDHGPIGARELTAVGAEPVVVAFAATHHHSRPAEIDPDDWGILQQADRVRRRSLPL